MQITFIEVRSLKCLDELVVQIVEVLSSYLIRRTNHMRMNVQDMDSFFVL